MLLHGLHNILNINSNLLFSVCVICVRELVDIDPLVICVRELVDIDPLVICVRELVDTDPLASTVELCCTFVEL